jgi:hypothetical protein
MYACVYVCVCIGGGWRTLRSEIQDYKACLFTALVGGYIGLENSP